MMRSLLGRRHQGSHHTNGHPILVVRAEWARLAICWIAAAVSWPGALTAQTPASAGPPIPVRPAISATAEMVVDPPAVTSAAVPAGAPQVPGQPQSPPASTNPRLDALLAIGFDRRAESILKEWSRSQLPTSPEKESPTPNDAVTKPAVDPKVAKALEEARVLQEEVALFSRWVTLGKWDRVAEYLRGLPKQDAKKVFEHLLTGLRTPSSTKQPRPMPTPVARRSMALIPGAAVGTLAPSLPTTPQAESMPGSNVLTPADIMGIVQAAPDRLSDRNISSLAELLRLVVAGGHVLDPLADALPESVGQLGGRDANGRRMAAQLLLEAGQLDTAKTFLPDWNAEATRSDRRSVELLADYQHAQFLASHKPTDLIRTWDLHQVLASLPGLPRSVQSKALGRLAEYSTQVEKELGRTWLEESFTKDLDRGVRLLTQFGSAVSVNFLQQPQNPQVRLAQLRLQNLAAEALIKVRPEKAHAWQSTLTRLAENWTREADRARQFTQDTTQQLMQRFDNFGNLYYVSSNDAEQQIHMIDQGDQPVPISIRDLIDQMPSPEWIALIDASLRPRFAILGAQLHLRMNDEKAAFPFIEAIADSHPAEARELVHSFLDVWTRNHDPNAMRQMYNPYMYIYGYNEQADTIPLTRSKQQRNLTELKEWVARIRKLPIEPMDESHLATAFTTCHSSAEVYRLQAFEDVFGNVGSLKPETVAKIAGTMQTNLGSIWRKVTTQEELKTQRKEADVQQEVLRGYNVAIDVVTRAQASHPANWRLQLALAALQFDRNAYEQSVRKSSEFSARRQDAFDQFALAAERYAQALPELNRSEQEATVYNTWFYAALGASDIRSISQENAADPRQYPCIRKAILALPGAAAEEHLGQFAKQLFERMGSVSPQAKFRYARAGLEIVQDHPRAREARKSLDYYIDVVSEIQLVTRLDGDDRVGHDQLFGLFVNLWHTAEMERESGGFQKYVQNQNNAAFVYNYGRPPENYREKFEKGAVQSLGEHFDVVSVTFENPKNMRSRPTAQDGWRETSFAYVTLKAKGAEVDRIPSLHLDLDFLDATGFVVIPIESPPLRIDAAAPPSTRPMQKLSIVQTLDERQAADGKLLLEIKATARGLVPSLDKILKLDVPGFIATIDDDQGAIPTELDPKSEDIQILSDRSWQVSLAGRPDAKGGNDTFRFCDAAVADVQNTFQRYQDADLVASQQVVPLAPGLQRVSSYGWWLGSIAAILALLGAAALIAWRHRPRRPAVRPRYQMPGELNPFTLLSLLYRIQDDPRLDAPAREELRNSIAGIERHYFAKENGEAVPDLSQIASRWIQRVN